jgi:hypothetical protein
LQEFFHNFVLKIFLLVILLKFLRVLWKSFSEKQGGICVFLSKGSQFLPSFRAVAGGMSVCFVTLLFPPVFFQTAAFPALFPISEKKLKTAGRPARSPAARGSFSFLFIISRRPIAAGGWRAFVESAFSSALPEDEFGDLYKVGHFASSSRFTGLKNGRLSVKINKCGGACLSGREASSSTVFPISYIGV